MFPLLARILLILTLARAATAFCATAAAPRPPNLIFILADDLGYGELGCYGQRIIQTPQIDRMAAEGMRFTDFYAGSTVCAPSRCVLMTGWHTGHAVVRDNGRTTLPAGQITVADVLRGAGYRTAVIGKWGLGDERDSGHPHRQGFDYSFGYLEHGHAHNYYPEFLFRGEDRVPLRNIVTPVGNSRGAGVATKRVDYTHDLLANDALTWLEQNRGQPFFLYFAPTIPHANNEARRAIGDGTEVPDFGDYATKDWSKQNKGHAAMISRLDRDVGRLLDRLRGLGLAGNTLVLFSSDNGPHTESEHDFEFFDPNGPLRGKKRDLYEGGIRVPTIAWWPGRIKSGTVNAHVGSFADLMATAAELAGVTAPAGRDGLSFLPTLLGRDSAQRKHEHLYWEFHTGGFSQAVRMGNWKAIRVRRLAAPIELYDLATDIGEQHDVARKHPEIVARAAMLFRTARVDSELWPVRDAPVKK